MQETSAQREQPSAATRRAGRARKACLMGFLLLCGPATGLAVDPYGSTLEKHFGATNAAPDWNQMTGSQIKVLDFEDALKAKVRKMAQTPPPVVSPETTQTASGFGSSLVLTVVLPSIALLAVGLAGFGVKRKFDALALASEAEANRRLNVASSDPALEAFFVALRDGLEGSPGHSEVHGAVLVDESPTVSLKDFFDSIADRLANLRGQVTELARAAGEADQKRVLDELCGLVCAIKETSRVPALQPVWMVACALEGLLTQLSRETSSCNASARRTATAAIDLLQALCVKDLNPNLATDPPVRILAVDDDAISRRAISFALKKAFDRTTLAVNGTTALELATTRAYDVIFLDVEMPDMDGFELCTKIRETAINKAVPIVFVTRHSDFESRAKSSLRGGQDLIGKPYLSFEITVKALTLILGNRLKGVSEPRRSVAAAGAAPTAAAKTPTAVVDKAPAAPTDKAPTDAVGKTPVPDADKTPVGVVKATDQTGKQGTKRQEGHWRKTFSTSVTATEGFPVGDDSFEKTDGHDAPPFPAAPAEHLPDTFSAWSPVYLETLRSQLQAAMLCNHPEHRQELVTGLYLAVHSFSVESERAGVAAIHRLSTSLEAMLKKLMEQPNFFTPSVWNAAVAAVALLADLPCRTGNNSDLNDPPARILVVDDDPVARRAVCGAIQLVFGRPEQADNGEAALAMTSEKPFDLIFLDILMPGIDGFATCSKIRGTKFNRKTPVVFVSNHDEAASREKAAMAGAHGFISKPVFSSQITLTALTSILRSRLDRTDGDSIMAVERDLAPVTA